MSWIKKCFSVPSTRSFPRSLPLWFLNDAFSPCYRYVLHALPRQVYIGRQRCFFVGLRPTKLRIRWGALGGRRFPRYVNAAVGCFARSPQNGHTRQDRLRREENKQTNKWWGELRVWTHTSSSGGMLALLSLSEAFSLCGAAEGWSESCRDAAVAPTAGEEFSFQLQHLTEDLFSLIFFIFIHVFLNAAAASIKKLC